MQYPKFDLLEILIAFGWLMVMIVVMHMIRNRHEDNPDYKYFLPNFYFKITLAVAFGCFYFFYYHGGDTIAYWSGSTNLSRLLLEDPVNFFKEISDNSKQEFIPSYYMHRNIGRPPIWIYKEPNSWFVCKIASFFSLITLESYLAMTLLFGWITSLISWRFFRFLSDFITIKKSLLAIAILFIPTVGFWCSGVMKDTVIWWTILLFILNVFIIFKDGLSVKNVIYLLFISFVLIQIRPFIFITLLAPAFLIFVFRFNKDKEFIIKFLTRILGIGLIGVFFVLYFGFPQYFGSFSFELMLENAQVIQQDFSQNTGYTGAKYDLGLTDFSLFSMLKVFPAALMTVFYRPFLWEATNPMMLINGLESILFFILTLNIFRKTRTLDNQIQESSTIQKEFIWFAILFAIFLGFFVGVTSGIFGVLARLKAPILPFLLLFLFSRIKNKTQSTNQ